MAIKEYRLPGVYSEELSTRRSTSFSGGYSTVAFVGRAQGYTIASKTGSLGGTSVTIDGSILQDVPITFRENKRSGSELDSAAFDVDFLTDAENSDKTVGVTISQYKVDLGFDYEGQLGSEYQHESMTVTDKVFTFDEANPSFCVHTDTDGNSAPGYIVAGTLVIKDADGNEFVYKKDRVADPDTGVEHWDYEVNWEENVVTAAATTSFAQNTELHVSYTWTYAEPVKLNGTSPYYLTHQYISPKSHLMDDGSTYVTADIRSCVYTDDAGHVHTWGLHPDAEWVDDGDGSGHWEDGDGPSEVDYDDDGYAVNGSGDFVIDYQKGTIARSSTTEKIPEYDSEYENLYYVSFGYCRVRDDDNIIINYAYVPDNYYQPTLCRTWNSCASLFGDAWDSSGSVVSELSACTWIATRNGARSFYVCAVEPVVTEDGDGNLVTTYPPKSWGAAFDRLTQIDGIDIVVPLSGSTDVHNLVLSHLDDAYTNDDERMAILGFDGTTDDGPLDDDTMISAARTIARNDVVLVAPSTFRFRNPASDFVGVQVIPGYWCSAALAGYLSSVPQFTSLTRKMVNGIFSANEYRTKVDKTDLAANGLCYVDEFNDGIRVVHGKTTSTASIIDQEANITLTKYYIVKNMRRMYETGYIGEPLTDNLIAAIRTAVTSTLVTLSSQDYIYDFGNVTVQQDEDDPTQVNIMFDYRPTYTLNYILIQFSVDATVGSSIGVMA